MNRNENQEELSKRAKLIIELVREFNSNDFIRTNLRENVRSESDFEKVFKYPEHLRTEKYSLDNFRMELLKWKDSTSNKVILHLHGGGYVGAFKNQYRKMAGLYSEVSHGASVLTIDYRVAPENPYPAALEDAIEAYEWLLKSGYTDTQIILAGDSAGGGLALALCQYLKEHKRALPVAIIAMSPWTDLTLRGESYVKNREIDPIFGNGNDELIFNNPYAGEEDLDSPYVSPIYGNYEGFPPMLIQVGTEEMLYSDSIALAAKAKEAGVKLKLTEYEGMFHVFQMAGVLMEESKKAWNEVGKFIEVIEGLQDEDRNSAS